MSGWGAASFKFVPTPGIAACVVDIVCLKSTDVGDVIKLLGFSDSSDCSSQSFFFDPT